MRQKQVSGIVPHETFMMPSFRARVVQIKDSGKLKSSDQRKIRQAIGDQYPLLVRSDTREPIWRYAFSLHTPR